MKVIRYTWRFLLDFYLLKSGFEIFCLSFLKVSMTKICLTKKNKMGERVTWCSSCSCAQIDPDVTYEERQHSLCKINHSVDLIY